jgi:hypothetical protein
MAAGLYGDSFIIERSLSSVSATNLTPFIAPCDLEVLGLVAYLATAPGSTDGVVLNGSNAPTSQTNVNAYNLWTSANAPSILGTSHDSFSTSSTNRSVVENRPYPLNYPLPGPSGTSGFYTAQAQATATETPVTAPPTIDIFNMAALVPPDNTYTDFNGFTANANILHAGDVLTLSVAAGGSGNSVGSAANLQVSLYLQRA